jgi:DNA invertase Pin-like site-specific DNA recombinase
MTIKAVGYVRVSTEEQAKDGESLRRQEAMIRAEAERQGWELVALFRDEGISGGKPANKRPGFAALVSLVRAKAVGLVIVADLSRLSRSQKDTLIFLEDVCGPVRARLFTLDKGFVENQTVSGTMDMTLKALLAEVYRKEISEKTLRAMQFKRQRGEKLGGDTPFGFDVMQGRLVPNESEQGVIRLVHAERQRGHSLRQVAAKLQARRVPTKRGLFRWNPMQVRRILAQHLERGNLQGEPRWPDRERAPRV